MEEELTIADHTTETGLIGLDELAAELGVKPGGTDTITLQGKSGDWYDWIAILAAHMRLMNK